jgi:hypothetical protein
MRQKEDLAKLTRLEIHQIRTWFANTRRRLRAKLKKELGNLNVGKGSKLRILNGKVDDDDDDDDDAGKSGKADDAFPMDANQIKSLVETILKVDSPKSSQEDSSGSSCTLLRNRLQTNQQMMGPNMPRQVTSEAWNPIRNNISSAQTMSSLHYAQPVAMMTYRNDASTMTLPYRNMQNPILRPSSSLGAPAPEKPMPVVGPLTCPIPAGATNRFEFPEMKRQAQMPNYSSSCPCLPTAPTRQYYQEDLIQISSDEDDRDYGKIKHSITSILNQQQQEQYQRVFGVPPPRTGFVQPSAPQQIPVNQHRFFSPPAPQRVVTNVQQATSAAFMPCSRVIDSRPMTQGCSYQQKQGTLFMPPNSSCLPNQHPAFASPRQPRWSPTNNNINIYKPLQMSQMYPSPVAVYRNFNNPSPIISANTLYSEPQYGYNQVMTPPWTPPVISPNPNNSMQVMRTPQTTMTKPGIDVGQAVIKQSTAPSFRLEKPPPARNLFSTPREEPPSKGLSILANLVKKEIPLPVKTSTQPDPPILDLSQPPDMHHVDTPESSHLVIGELPCNTVKSHLSQHDQF